MSHLTTNISENFLDRDKSSKMNVRIVSIDFDYKICDLTRKPNILRFEDKCCRNDRISRLTLRSVIILVPMILKKNKIKDSRKQHQSLNQFDTIYFIPNISEETISN